MVMDVKLNHYDHLKQISSPAVQALLGAEGNKDHRDSYRQ